MAAVDLSGSDFLGFSIEERRLYLRVLSLSGRPVEEVAESVGLSRAALLAGLPRCQEMGVVDLAPDGRLHVLPPTLALAALVGRQTAAIRQAADGIDDLREALPVLGAALSDPLVGGDQLSGEIRTGGDTHGLLESWARNSSGDLLWLRPDQWRRPEEPTMLAAVADAVAEGRRSRAIYPVRVLDEMPQRVFDRVDVGEEARFLPSVPTRLAIVAGAGALTPELWDVHNERRIVVREPGLVAGLVAYFEELWDRAVVLPGAVPGDPVALEERRNVARAGRDERRLVLDQLARGVKDEQIARALGVSLRTVRRRIADLLQELGVRTRFQAGVEASRRGWL